MNFFSCKKHTQPLRMKMHGSMILMGRFSILMEHLTLAVLQLLTLVKRSLSLIDKKLIKLGGH